MEGFGTAVRWKLTFTEIRKMQEKQGFGVR